MAMTILKLDCSVYVILGIDVYGHDQVLAVARTYEEAKQYSTQCFAETEFYDLWIEKHAII